MALKLITPAATPAVSLAEAKLAYRFDASDLDSDINSMLLECDALVGHENGICLMPQTWELSFDSFPDAISLTRTPVASVTSVKYIDSNGTLQTLSNTAYTVSTVDAYGPATITPVYGTSWPSTRDQINAVTVRFVAGYADAASVPPHLKREVKINIAMTLDDPAQMASRFAAISKVWGQ